MQPASNQLDPAAAPRRPDESPSDDFAAINRRSWSLAQFGLVYGCLYGLVYGATLATIVGWAIVLANYDAISRPTYSDGRLALALTITMPAAMFGGFVGIVLGAVVGYIVGALAAKDCNQAVAARRTSIVAIAIASALLCAVETSPLLNPRTFSASIGLVVAGCAIASLVAGAFAGRIFSIKMLRAAQDAAAHEAAAQLAAAKHAAELDDAEPAEDFDSINRRNWSLAQSGLIYGCLYGILFSAILATAIGLTTALPYTDAWSRSDFAAQRLAPIVRVTISFAIFGAIAGGLFNMALGYTAGVLIARDEGWAVVARRMSIVACTIASTMLCGLEMIALANGPHDRSAFGVLTIGWLVTSLVAGALAGHMFSAKVLRAARDVARNKANATTAAQQDDNETSGDDGSLNRRSRAMARHGLLYGALFGSATGALLAITLTSTIVSNLTIGIRIPGELGKSLPRVCPLLPLAVVAGVGSLIGEASGAIVGFIVAASAANPRIGMTATRSLSMVLSMIAAITFTAAEAGYASANWWRYFSNSLFLGWAAAAIAFGAIGGALLANKLISFAPPQRQHW